MLKKCAICGKEDDESNMRSRFTGRMKWFCYECYVDGDRQAVGRVIERHAKHGNETRRVK